ncbi:MAG: HAD hydrolase family protein [Dialister sp.]|nr:HAD hydrolase family protein [Dialister sp.]
MRAAEKIKLIAFDVDGTLTPGTLAIGLDGEAWKLFHVKDGLAISLAHRMGYRTGLITGRASQAVLQRARELRMDFVVMGARDKVAAMEGKLKECGLSWEQAAYMGDDLNDIPLLKRSAFAGTPADGAAEAKASADFIAKVGGGQGAAREFIEAIMKAQSRWDEAVAFFGQVKPDELRQ